MEIIAITILALVVVFICVVVIKTSYLEADAEKHSLTLFFIHQDTTNPDILLKQLSASYYGKIIIVNIDATEECCTMCRILCEENSHLAYCELSNLKQTIHDEYLRQHA
jgi:hypothetical protein